MVKGKVSAGQNVLITGIGGGVAILALQLCIAKGANVYVTSGNEDKVRRAIQLGARGGTNYKDSKAAIVFAMSVEADNARSSSLETAEDWPTQLSALLSKDAKEIGGTGLLDVVIDSGGGGIMAQTGKILKHGGSVVCYGM